MADECTDAIVFSGIELEHACADLLEQAQVLCNLGLSKILIGIWRDQPDSVSEQMSIGKFHASVLFSRHGVSWQKAFGDIGAKHITGTGHDFGLGTADVSDERV